MKKTQSKGLKIFLAGGVFGTYLISPFGPASIFNLDYNSIFFYVIYSPVYIGTWIYESIQKLICLINDYQFCGYIGAEQWKLKPYIFNILEIISVLVPMFIVYGLIFLIISKIIVRFKK